MYWGYELRNLLQLIAADNEPHTAAQFLSKTTFIHWNRLGVSPVCFHLGGVPINILKVLIIRRNYMVSCSSYFLLGIHWKGLYIKMGPWISSCKINILGITIWSGLPTECPIGFWYGLIWCSPAMPWCINGIYRDTQSFAGSSTTPKDLRSTGLMSPCATCGLIGTRDLSRTELSWKRTMQNGFVITYLMCEELIWWFLCNFPKYACVFGFVFSWKIRFSGKNYICDNMAQNPFTNE